MNPTVFTYHQKIPTWDHGTIVKVWKQNWKRHNWRPIVMGREMAKRHTMFGDFITKIRTFPTINDPAYEEACYIRWLALEVMMDATDGRATMSDYDVFNNGFTREDQGLEDVVCHEITRVPCLVSVTKKGARQIIDFIMSREPDHKTGHYSDMYAFKESDFRISGFCQELGEIRGAVPWKESKTIHAASGAIDREAHGWDKTKYIMKHYH